MEFIVSMVNGRQFKYLVSQNWDVNRQLRSIDNQQIMIGFKVIFCGIIKKFGCKSKCMMVRTVNWRIWRFN